MYSLDLSSLWLQCTSLQLILEISAPTVNDSYHKIPKISLSMYKPFQISASQTGNSKKLSYELPSKIQAPGALYSEIAFKFKIKQSKNCTVTHKFLHLPKNYYVCQMIAVKKCYSIMLFASSLFRLAWINIFLGPYRQSTRMVVF